MAFNVQKTAQVPLSVFGGLVREMSPADLPEGVSPDCSDVVFAPGSVASRPALQEVFAIPFPKGSATYVATVTYAKTFASANFTYNLYLDSNGNLWYEDVLGSPGTYTSLATGICGATGGAVGGALARSVTAFGREYIAISDGQVSTDVALQWDGTNLDRVTQEGPGAGPTVASVAGTSSSLATSGSLVRSGGTVTATTQSAHGLNVGNLAQIAGAPACVIYSFAGSIVINNESLPGIATVNLPLAHGLSPGSFVSITGVGPTVVGTSVTGAAWVGGVLTITTSAPHGLTPGALVSVYGIGGTTPSYNMTGPVLNIINTTQFTLAMVIPALPTGTPTYSGAAVEVLWPIPDTGTPSYFQVLSCPTPISLQVAVNYCDGTWGMTNVVISLASNGTFYVLSVPSPTTFTYTQYGPPGTVTASAGTVTAFGQWSPGIHQCRVSFLTRNGYLTQPSPPVQFTCPGGQYVQVTNLPIGPPNVVARVLQFTGAAGAFFFYIPSTPQINGQVVGTSTQVNDNTTASVTLDCADNTLFAAVGTSIPGNDLAAQVVFDGAVGFGFYDSRLFAFGVANRIQNLLNMSFSGGSFASHPHGFPCGWTVTAGSASLVNAHFGTALQAMAGTSLQQPCFADGLGNAILTPNKAYSARLWASPVSGSPVINVGVSSVLSGFGCTFGFAVSGTGWYYGELAPFPMPSPIPPDMILKISVSGGTCQLNDLSLVFVEEPLVSGMYGSYVNNPEAFDGVTGLCGPANDTHQIFDAVAMKGSLYVLTQDPGGRLHHITDNGVTEPADWPVTQVGANCGVLSPFATTKSQSDDSTSSGGEEWFAWASATGARICDGTQPWKISQEIEPDWESITPVDDGGSPWQTWALNDPAGRTLYFGLPIGAAPAPTKVYAMNYRELDTAFQIASAPPIHTSYTGRLIATDHTRKWSPWNVEANGAALMMRPSGLAVTLLGGNGSYPGHPADGYGNVYTLNPAKYTDDDYGRIFPYYTTYFFVTHDLEQALQLGGVRKMVAYLTAFVAGLGTLTITPLCDSLTNAWPLTGVRTLGATPTFDLEWGGGNAMGQRIALKFASAPATGTDNWFNLQKVLVAMRVAKMPVRGSAT